jgi:hypothetical protein
VHSPRRTWPGLTHRTPSDYLTTPSRIGTIHSRSEPASQGRLSECSASQSVSSLASSGVHYAKFQVYVKHRLGVYQKDCHKPCNGIDIRRHKSKIKDGDDTLSIEKVRPMAKYMTPEQARAEFVTPLLTRLSELTQALDRWDVAIKNKQLSRHDILINEKTAKLAIERDLRRLAREIEDKVEDAIKGVYRYRDSNKGKLQGDTPSK